MAYLNGNMNIMRFVTRENEAPRYKEIFPLKVDSVGDAVSEWYLYGNKQGVGEKQIVKGNLPLNFVSDGTNLENYRVYGTAEGAGEIGNLFNKNAPYTSGKYLNTSGAEVSGATWGISEYIPIEGNTTYTAYNLSGSGASACWYDENKTYIDGEAYAGAATISFSLPSNARYIRLTLRLINPSNVNTLMLIKGTIPPPEYIPFGYKIPLVTVSGTESKDTVIPIGDTKLKAGDFIDYKSGKIYKAKRIHEDTVTIDGIEWDILDYDHDEVYKADGTRAKHTVTIQTHDCINELQYSARQAAFAFPNGLAAGTYHFTVGAHPWVAGNVGKVLTFTLSSAIPAGGQLVFNGVYNQTLVGTTVSVFASATETTASETATMTEGSTGTDLGTILRSKTDTINSIDRALSGSNNCLKSPMHQYLNSDKTAGNVWTPQTVFDRPPIWASTIAGFLNGKSNNFISHIGTTKKTTGLSNVDGGGTAVHDEKVFLLSCSEVYAGDEYTGGEGTPYLYYKDYSDNPSPSKAADSNRIKYHAGTATNWWLRSPVAGNASAVMRVNTSGLWHNTIAIAIGDTSVAPACCIVLDDIDDWVKQTFYTETTVDLPAIETFNGDNTLDSTETLGETTITQGYHVPLDIRSENNEKHMDIYIGDSPLTEGQSVSRDSTGIEIEVEQGTSVIETTLTNKPEMIITPDSYDKIKDMLLNTKQYDYNETQTDYITDEVTEVTQ